MSIRGFIAEFVAAKQARGLSSRTIEHYRSRCGRFATWLEGQPDPSLSRANLRRYVAELQQHNLSPTTVAAYFRDVVVLCNWLVDEGILQSNPATKLAPRVPKRKPASYRPEQLQALLDVCDLRDRTIIVVLLDTGLRVAELCSLNRDSFDQDGRFCIIGKGNKERVNWLSKYALASVKAYVQSRTDSNSALWVTQRGSIRLTPNGVHQIIKRRAQQAGIRAEVRRLLHSFRVTFAKNYVRQGGDLQSLADLLGHESIAMSAHYAQLAEDELAEKKAKVNALAAVIHEAK